MVESFLIFRNKEKAEENGMQKISMNGLILSVNGGKDQQKSLKSFFK
jgi:hypothetical protein